MSSIITRMNKRINICTMAECLEVNFADDAQETYRDIFPSKNEEYVDPDLYSPLLYKFWGELLKKKGIIESYDIITKNYRYVIKVEYVHKQCRKSIILGSDGLMSIGKCTDDIKKHRYIGGFALWPSHRGGINFRKNRHSDDIFKTLDDIDKFYRIENKDEYKGVIPKSDYEWFDYLKEKGDFMSIFFFDGYVKYENLLSFENDRTKKMIKFLKQ